MMAAFHILNLTMCFIFDPLLLVPMACIWEDGHLFKPASDSRAYQGQTLNSFSVIIKGCQCIIGAIVLLLGTWLLAGEKWKIQCSCLTVRDMIRNTKEQKKSEKSYPVQQMNGYWMSKEIWNPNNESLSCQASHSVPFFKEKLIQKGLSPASHSLIVFSSSIHFLPSLTVFPP